MFRDDKEMLWLNGELADNAFKKYKKEILDVFMAQQGFSKWKTRAYVKLNPIGLLEYMDLQKERYGSKTFCVNFSVTPLYYGVNDIRMSLGDRLGAYISGKDFWWDYADSASAKASFQNVAEAIKLYLLPWFEYYSDESNYRQILSEYPDQTWLEAFDSQDKESIIEENINILKLPKKIRVKGK